MEGLEKWLYNREFLDKWDCHYNRLKAFSKQQGAIPGAFDEELTRWVCIQRNIMHMLPDELKKKLAALNLNFEGIDSTWESRYKQLARFVQKSGYACLPADQKHEVLKDWLIRQILNRRYLSESQFKRLDSLGVDWGTAISRDHRWEQMFLKLKDFYSAFGHCLVPQRWAMDRQLALWVSTQRREHSRNKLREDRERKLRELGFVWSVKTIYDSQWERYFQQLASFQQTHGHCRVPSKQEKLASWIERQRTAKTNKLLPADRERLDEINFIWRKASPLVCCPPQSLSKRTLRNQLQISLILS